MGYTNSSLVSYTKISPNKSAPRNHAIDTVTIHCVVGQASVESLGNLFSKTSRKASCNYGIGTDGRIALIVDEKDRSWCSSSSDNDNRAITIECASDATEPYAVNDKVMTSLIKLLADVCKRNGIKELKWEGDKNLIGQVAKQNMTAHRWFANKSCPGTYLYEREGEIASKVNAIINPVVKKTTYVSSNKLVKVTTPALHIRKGAGIGYAITGTIRGEGIYTIVDEKNGWGKLKSGAGWIYLSYTKTIQEASKKVSVTTSKTYTVKSGDNLWNIAKAEMGNGSRFKDIMEANELDSDVLHTGMKLLIPTV